MQSITFVCEPIRHRDENGRLIGAGAVWREGTQLKRGRIYIGVLVSGGALLLLWLGVAAGVMALMSIALVGLAFAGVLFLWPSPERELILDVGGIVRTPLGTCYNRDAMFWDIPSADVISIEVSRHQLRREEFRHDVALLTDDGETIRIAGDLHVEHATRVARQLTKALAETRAAEGGDLFHAVAR